MMKRIAKQSFCGTQECIQMQRVPPHMVWIFLALLLAACSCGGAGGSNTTGLASPPKAPAALSATPGDQHVSLSWSASASATSYNVKRAMTAGGPYTLAGT